MKAGDRFSIDGENLIFFRQSITAGGDVDYEFTDSLKTGYPTMKLKQSQLNSLIKTGRVICYN